MLWVSLIPCNLGFYFNRAAYLAKFKAGMKDGPAELNMNTTSTMEKSSGPSSGSPTNGAIEQVSKGVDEFSSKKVLK